MGDAARQVKIKVGVAKRRASTSITPSPCEDYMNVLVHLHINEQKDACPKTLKEYESYGKEIKTQSEKIAKMKSENADFHDIKQQEEVLKEAEACVIDAKRRLGGALQDLEAIVDEHGEGLADNADMQEAKALLEANPPPEN